MGYEPTSTDLLLETAQADYFWAPAVVRIVDRPELCYATSDRHNVFFNSVVRARPAEVSPAELCAEVEPLFAGKPSRWSLNAFSDTPEMRAELERNGYALSGEFHGYTLDPMSYSRSASPHVQARRVSTLEELRQLDTVAVEVFGGREHLSDDDLRRELEDCTGHQAPRVARFVAWVDGVGVGAGGITLFPALGCAFIWAGGVLEAYRGRGVYTALLAARCEFAASRGVDVLGVYGNAETSGPILKAHGFTRHGRMNHWLRLG